MDPHTENRVTILTDFTTRTRRDKYKLNVDEALFSRLASSNEENPLLKLTLTYSNSHLN